MVRLRDLERFLRIFFSRASCVRLRQEMRQLGEVCNRRHFPRQRIRFGAVMRRNGRMSSTAPANFRNTQKELRGFLTDTNPVKASVRDDGIRETFSERKRTG